MIRSSRFPNLAAKQPTNTQRKLPKLINEIVPPSLTIQFFELLRDHGFAFDEARDLAAGAVDRFNRTRERTFVFGPVAVRITGGLRTELISAPANYETPRRTLERIAVQENIELDKRAAEIRERRLRDESRRPW